MQQLNPSEISALIKQRITDLDTSATAKTEGTIVMVSDGIVRQSPELAASIAAPCEKAGLARLFPFASLL